MSRLTTLSTGIPRRFTDHRRETGVLYRIHYRALEAELGPFTGSEVLRSLAADAAACKVRLIMAERNWEQGTTKRQLGRGRRPSEQNVRALAKRCALEQGSYSAALDRLVRVAQRAREQRGSVADLFTVKA